ncbi:hypothetical protein AOXY_G7060 [Acipenser oxyrinchus oxyrinchus]|uniref:Uncharacterized protein n=1 Tax=Acipenser oxyrinchus oxyrinchus TaxID=40147 RepID=A0AAD8G9Q0_ACIOX|nr:hypothetical protein AOXY_G7060 [Acipenser oxyrinchus oxyrinchus]
MGSRPADLRRTTSAGYRLPEISAVDLTSNCTTSASRQTENKSRTAESSGKNLPPAGNSEKRDTVKQDQIWKESIHAEWQGNKQWQRNWSFLKDFDQLGRPKAEEPLPEYVPVFSDKVPNTTNRTFGSRMNTDIGQTLIHKDSLLLRGNRRKKLSQDLLPC